MNRGREGVEDKHVEPKWVLVQGGRAEARFAAALVTTVDQYALRSKACICCRVTSIYKTGGCLRSVRARSYLLYICT
jgi:hypothetical protein